MTRYISENIRLMQPGDTKPAYTLQALATYFDMSLQYMREKSSKNGWSVALKEALLVRQQTAADKVMTLQIVNEVEVRTRQARCALQALDKAIAAIRLLDPKKMSAKDAIALLRVGLQEERRALGLIDKVTYEADSGDAEAQKLTAVQQAMAIIDRIAKERPTTKPEDGKVIDME